MAVPWVPLTAPDMDLGAKPPKCRLDPTVNHTGQELGGEFVRHFQILIVSVFSALQV